MPAVYILIKFSVCKGGVWLASWKCSEESFSHQVKSRDPLELGFVSVGMFLPDIYSFTSLYIS